MTADRSAAGEKRRKVLAMVEGSEPTGRVIEYLIECARANPVEAVVLNVQPKPEDWRLRGYRSFKYDEIVDRLINDRGAPIVASVGQKLERAGIAHKDRIELGDPAETILRCAVEEDCDTILIGEVSPGPLRRWLLRALGLSFGSISSQVVQQAAVPVVVVK